jgi:hypothetical protein
MLVTGKDSANIGFVGVKIPAHYLKEAEFGTYCIH